MVRPEFYQAKSEVVYLFQLLDEDRSLDISPKEIMNRPQAFLSSQVRTCTYRVLVGGSVHLWTILGALHRVKFKDVDFFYLNFSLLQVITLLGHSIRSDLLATWTETKSFPISSFYRRRDAIERLFGSKESVKNNCQTHDDILCFQYLVLY